MRPALRFASASPTSPRDVTRPHSGSDLVRNATTRPAARGLRKPATDSARSRHSHSLSRKTATVTKPPDRTSDSRATLRPLRPDARLTSDHDRLSPIPNTQVRTTPIGKPSHRFRSRLEGPCDGITPTLTPRIAKPPPQNAVTAPSTCATTRLGAVSSRPRGEVRIVLSRSADAANPEQHPDQDQKHHHRQNGNDALADLRDLIKSRPQRPIRETSSSSQLSPSPTYLLGASLYP